MTKRTPDEWLCLARAQQERFWAKVNKHGPAHPTIAEAEPCWVWTGGIARGGYGKFSIIKSWCKACSAERRRPARKEAA